MKRTQIYLPDELHRELHLLAKRKGKSFSELVRDGVRRVIRANGGKKQQKSTAAFFSRPPVKYRFESKKNAVDLVREVRYGKTFDS